MLNISFKAQESIPIMEYYHFWGWPGVEVVLLSPFFFFFFGSSPYVLGNAYTFFLLLQVSPAHRSDSNEWPSFFFFFFGSKHGERARYFSPGHVTMLSL